MIKTLVASSYLYVSLGLLAALCDVQQTSFQPLLFGSKCRLQIFSSELCPLILALCCCILSSQMEDLTAVLRWHSAPHSWQVLLRAVHALFLRETVALLRVCQHGRRSQRGVSLELLSPAELRDVHQLEPLSPTSTLLRLIALKNYRVIIVKK